MSENQGQLQTNPELTEQKKAVLVLKFQQGFYDP